MNEEYDDQLDVITAITEKFAPWITALEKARKKAEETKVATKELGDETEALGEKIAVLSEQGTLFFFALIMYLWPGSTKRTKAQAAPQPWE